MPKKQSTASKKARKDVRQGAKFTAAHREHSHVSHSDHTSQAQCADSREEYINELWDAEEVPEMVKVCLYELAGGFPPNHWWMDCTVTYSSEVLADTVGLDVEAAEFCIDIAEELGWVKDRTDASLTLRYPKQDLDMWLENLQQMKEPVTDLARYEKKKMHLATEVEALRNGPKITAQGLREVARAFGYL
ncbi:hypothetical protein ACFZAR_31055 [Streptomyces sp. NPDC008222]|uniref:hypothetical protein n=1 Tax=Streptomyces sp. NPDC008222 TaxID=3364820 RepID=UPI0036F0E635